MCHDDLCLWPDLSHWTFTQQPVSLLPLPLCCVALVHLTLQLKRGKLKISVASSWQHRCCSFMKAKWSACTMIHSSYSFLPPASPLRLRHLCLSSLLLQSCCCLSVLEPGQDESGHCLSILTNSPCAQLSIKIWWNPTSSLLPAAKHDVWPFTFSFICLFLPMPRVISGFYVVFKHFGFMCTRLFEAAVRLTLRAETLSRVE